MSLFYNWKHYNTVTVVWIIEQHLRHYHRIKRVRTKFIWLCLVAILKSGVRWRRPQCTHVPRASLTFRAFEKQNTTRALRKWQLGFFNIFFLTFLIQNELPVFWVYFSFKRVYNNGELTIFIFSVFYL